MNKRAFGKGKKTMAFGCYARSTHFSLAQSFVSFALLLLIDVLVAYFWLQSVNEYE